MRHHQSACTALLAAIAMHALLGGCGRPEVAGPPALRLGRDECAACGMQIDDERCSSALLVDHGGDRSYALFDDVGCMLDYQNELAADSKVLDSFVHDYATKSWVTHNAAQYLIGYSDRLRTPMASGIVAFADLPAAQQAQEKFGGEIVGYSLVVAKRGQLKAGREKASTGPR